MAPINRACIVVAFIIFFVSVTIARTTKDIFQNNNDDSGYFRTNERESIPNHREIHRHRTRDVERRNRRQDIHISHQEPQYQINDNDDTEDTVQRNMDKVFDNPRMQHTRDRRQRKYENPSVSNNGPYYYNQPLIPFYPNSLFYDPYAAYDDSRSGPNRRGGDIIAPSAHTQYNNFYIAFPAFNPYRIENPYFSQPFFWPVPFFPHNGCLPPTQEPPATEKPEVTKSPIDTHTEEPTSENPDFGNRIGGDEEYTIRDVSFTRATPRRPPSVTAPPILHQSNSNSIAQDQSNSIPGVADTSRVVYPVEEDSDDDRFNRPPGGRAQAALTSVSPIVTTLRPSGFSSSAARQPPKCVWAILSCCNQENQGAIESCFTGQGCPGPFWDVNPCNSSIARKAFDLVSNFYGQ